MLYFGILVGILIGIAVMSWRNNYAESTGNNVYVVRRRFEYSSGQLMAYNTVREVIENNPDKFKLICLKMTGMYAFDTLGILLKYRSLNGHVLTFNYDMSRATIENPKHVNKL